MPAAFSPLTPDKIERLMRLMVGHTLIVKRDATGEADAALHAYCREHGIDLEAFTRGMQAAGKACRFDVCNTWEAYKHTCAELMPALVMRLFEADPTLFNHWVPSTPPRLASGQRALPPGPSTALTVPAKPKRVRRTRKLLE